MTYQDRLKEHLTNYKHSVLGISELGKYTHKGKELEYEHILPLRNADSNLFPRVLPLEQARGLRAQRHKYFCHLNSSQALAYNLFLPFFSGGPEDSAALLRALGQDGTVASWELEAIPMPEEESNLDALWTSNTGLTTVCEVKLSEGEFGTADNDDRHRRKLAEIYRPVLARIVAPELLTEPAFFRSYQVLRNVWHMVRIPSSALLFLMPKANEGLWSALPPILGKLSQDTQARIRLVAIEDVLAALAADRACPAELRAYAADLASKYVVAA